MAMLFKETGPLPKGRYGPADLGTKAESSAPVQGAEMENKQPLKAEGVERIETTIEPKPSGPLPSRGAVSHPPAQSAPAGRPRQRRTERRRTRVICVVNRKGGVGKTTTTFNLAGALAQVGYQVLVIDMDPMGSLCRSIGIFPGETTLSDVLVGGISEMGYLVQPTHIPKVFAIPGDPNLRTFSMRHASSPGYRRALRDKLSGIIELEAFHYVLIDCPPSLGLISGNAMAAADEAIIPVDGSTYGMGALVDTLAIIKMVQKNVNRELDQVRLLLGNVDLGTVYDRTVLDVLKRRLQGSMFNTVIPTSPKIDEATQMGKPVTEYAPSSWIAKAYLQLAREVTTGNSSSA